MANSFYYWQIAAKVREAQIMKALGEQQKETDTPASG